MASPGSPEALASQLNQITNPDKQKQALTKWILAMDSMLKVEKQLGGGGQGWEGLRPALPRLLEWMKEYRPVGVREQAACAVKLLSRHTQDLASHLVSLGVVPLLQACWSFETPQSYAGLKEESLAVAYHLLCWEDDAITAPHFLGDAMLDSITDVLCSCKQVKARDLSLQCVRILSLGGLINSLPARSVGNLKAFVEVAAAHNKLASSTLVCLWSLPLQALQQLDVDLAGLLTALLERVDSKLTNHIYSDLHCLLLSCRLPQHVAALKASGLAKFVLQLVNGSSTGSSPGLPLLQDLCLVPEMTSDLVSLGVVKVTRMLAVCSLGCAGGGQCGEGELVAKRGDHGACEACGVWGRGG